MTKSERTRQYIIEKTAPLFNKKGFEGTTLADLTEVTGLTKGALYGNFHDKEEISVEAFRYSMQRVKALMRTNVGAANTNRKKLEAILNFFAGYVFNPPVPGGCPLLNTAVEADDHRTSMRKAVASELVQVIDFIAALISKGIKAGEFRADCKPRELAYVFFCAVEGALMFSRVERSDESMKVIVKHCKKILDQISLS